ncbi:MAG: recombinase family protein [Gemmatimonadota bacterium]
MSDAAEQSTFFIYCRKSSEDDRQASSIGDQLRELQQLVEREGLVVAAEPFTEEKSAKGPGRPIFHTMLAGIEGGEADALLCWDIDRLYRNPVDEGRVRWLLQRGIIREIRTPFRTYHPHDAGLLMGVEGGRATDHIITLRKGVLRGFRGKLERGERPGLAPPGYLNDRTGEPGNRPLLSDPERFPLIRRAWDLMLTSRHSIRDIQRIAAEEWGLRSRKTRRQGGKPYATSTWYRIFTDPFYYGSFWWKTPGTNRRKLYQGSHQPMITQREFDWVQELIRGNGKPRPRKRYFPFTGLIRCGECGGMITAEEKRQVICSACKHKFSSLNRDACPKCALTIHAMTSPTRLHYVYYRCTKRKRQPCSQRFVRADDLEGQIDAVLATCEISQEFARLAIRALREDDRTDHTAREQQAASLKKRRDRLRRQIEHINRLVLSPDTDWSLISQEEVREEKERLVSDLKQTEGQIADGQKHHEVVTELTERTFLFGAFVRFWFHEGGSEQKREILHAIGSNLKITDQKLHIDVEKPIRILSEISSRLTEQFDRFEPEKKPINKKESLALLAEIPWLQRGMNDVRTYWREIVVSSRSSLLRAFLQEPEKFERFVKTLRVRRGGTDVRRNAA